MTHSEVNKERLQQRAMDLKGYRKLHQETKTTIQKSIGKKVTKEDHKKYKEYKSMLQRIKRKAKMDHYQDKCQIQE